MILNISEARSQIVDADFAVEMAEVARLKILQTAGVAMLGTANLSLQLTLRLLEDL